MDILISVAAKVIECCTFEPIGHQVGYIYHYNENMKSLEDQTQNLKNAKDRMKQEVDQATSNGYKIFKDISQWLAKVEGMIKELEKGSRPNNPSCFNLIERHRLSRRAKKTVKEIDDVLQARTMIPNNVGYPAPLQGIQRCDIPDYQILESRTLMANQIKDALASPNVNKIGVHGMGGVGKSMLLREVEELVNEQKLFDQVITVVVGETYDVIGMQDKIGDKLHGLGDHLKTKEGRADLLRMKLMQKNMLIILDDLWTPLDLVDVGIPCKSDSNEKGCKILMTSRSHDLLKNSMKADQCFQMNSLSEEESWKFFTTINGGKFGNNSKEHIAKDVVRKCGGLPVALKIIASALKEKDVRIWKDALKQLENPVSVNIEGVNDEVFSLLKFSYDNLKGEAQSLFLLCSVFPDDYDIWVKDLQMYAMGMRLLEGVNTWDEAKNRVIKLVDDLKSSSLIEHYSSWKGYVRMHDMVRATALYIISNFEDKMSTLSYGRDVSEWDVKDRRGSYRAIFVDCGYNLCLPSNLKFPKLELIILKSKRVEVPNTFFEGMEQLKVLDMTSMSFHPLWTSLTNSFKNLQTLCITYCNFDAIDIISELKKLEILRLAHGFFKELPASMSELTQLKVLDISYCFTLRLIPPNIISSMTKLEELYLWMSFRGWGEEVVSKKNKIVKNVDLSELNCLQHLSNLRLEISNVNILSHHLSSPTWKLQEFCISVGDSYIVESSSLDEYAMTLILGNNSQFVSTDGVVEALFQECAQLVAVNLLVSFETNTFKKLRSIKMRHCKQQRILFPFSVLNNIFELEEIEVNECEMMEAIIVSSLENEDGIITTTCSRLRLLKLENVQRLTSFCTKQPIMGNQHTSIIPFFGDQVSFPELETLNISQADNLEMLWHNNHGLTQIENSFCRLQEITIFGCDKLRYIFTSNVVASLGCLSSLHISYCMSLEKIFKIENRSWKGKNDANIVPLTELLLSDLPNLQYVWNKYLDGYAILPNVKDVVVYNCPQVKYLFPASFIKYIQKIEILKLPQINEIFQDQDEPSNLGGQIVFFGRLRRLEMSYKIAVKRSLWFTIESFPKLENLTLTGSKKDDEDHMASLPLKMSQVLYTTEELVLNNVFQLVQLFKNNEEETNHIQRRRQSQKLKKLFLNNLPNLRHVWEENNGMITTNIDSLEYIDVTKCENLECLLPSSFTFKNLVQLDINCCNKISNLFSSSVAKSMVNLKRCRTNSCKGMSSILENNGGGEEENGEIIFYKLNHLSFNNMPRLAGFQLGKCPLRFPCLEYLIIEGCPQLKIFSYGIITAPKLLFICIRGVQIPVSPGRGINVIIQHHWEDAVYSWPASETCSLNRGD